MGTPPRCDGDHAARWRVQQGSRLGSAEDLCPAEGSPVEEGLGLSGASRVQGNEDGEGTGAS